MIEDGGRFYTFTHWGRTGAVGQSKLDGPFGTAEEAIALFEEKFKEKTDNDWSNKVAGKNRRALAVIL